MRETQNTENSSEILHFSNCKIPDKADPASNIAFLESAIKNCHVLLSPSSSQEPYNTNLKKKSRLRSCGAMIPIVPITPRRRNSRMWGIFTNNAWKRGVTAAGDTDYFKLSNCTNYRATINYFEQMLLKFLRQRNTGLL